MKETINSRLADFIEKAGHTKFSLSKKLGVSPSAIGYLVGNGDRQSKPSAEMLEKLATACPDLNLNWLVAGQGAMLLDTPATKDPDCWALLQNEQARRQQLQADYDALMARFQQHKQGA